MKKLLLGAACIMLIAAACQKQTNNPQPIPEPNELALLMYDNSQYNFEFKYPEEFRFSTPLHANLQDDVVQISIDKDEYPGTNFGDAAFSVSVGTASSEAQCLGINPPQNGDGFQTPEVINDIVFKKTDSNGAAAGNRYDSRVYRAFRGSGNLCYELALTIHTTNIGNYEPGTVEEVAMDEVWTRLDNIKETFKFN